MGREIAHALLAITAAFGIGLCARTDGIACSCNWVGPFLDVAPGASLIVRAKVARHSGRDRRGEPAAMDLKVEEVFLGDPSVRSLRVHGSEGWLCREDVSRFPVGTHWILALNGPGAKPGAGPDHSLSACGQYWLRVADGKVAGNLDNPISETDSREISLVEFRTLLTERLGRGGAPLMARLSFQGEVRRGEIYEREFGPGLILRLDPLGSTGWLIRVREKGRPEEDLSRLTPPFHGTPNPREIEGWHFRNADNTGPNEPGEKNVNAPGNTRDFIFSPEVGRSIQGPGAAASPSPEDIEAVSRYGKGRLVILEYELDGLTPGAVAGIERMRFEGVLVWRRGTDPGPPGLDRSESR